MPSLYVGPMKELISSTVAPKAKVKKVVEKHAEMAEKELKKEKKTSSKPKIPEYYSNLKVGDFLSKGDLKRDLTVYRIKEINKSKTKAVISPKFFTHGSGEADKLTVTLKQVPKKNLSPDHYERADNGYAYMSGSLKLVPGEIGYSAKRYKDLK